MSHIATYKIGLTGKVHIVLLAQAAQGVANLLGASCTVTGGGDIRIAGPFMARITLGPDGPVISGRDLPWRVQNALRAKGLPTDQTLADLLRDRYIAMALATVAAQRGYNVTSQQSLAGGIALLATK